MQNYSKEQKQAFNDALETVRKALVSKATRYQKVAYKNENRVVVKAVSSRMVNDVVDKLKIGEVNENTRNHKKLSKSRC